MTIVELSIGLAITAMVTVALGGLWYAVGKSWSASEQGQHAQMAALQTVARMESYVREAKYLIQMSAGSIDGTAGNATLFYWNNDNWQPSPSDGQPQLGELAYIEHDKSARKIYLYIPLPYSAMNADQRVRAGAVATWSELSASSTPGLFKSYDFVQKKVIAEGVKGIKFYVPNFGNTARPALEFSMKLERDEEKVMVYGTAALRGPTTRPQ
jgi:hypothetical protein